MSASLPEAGCMNTTAQLGESGANVTEGNQLGFLDSVDILLRTCPSGAKVRIDASPATEVTGDRDAQGCLQALSEPPSMPGDMPLSELQPGRSFCIGDHTDTTVFFLELVEVDVPTTTVTWAVTRWSDLDIPPE